MTNNIKELITFGQSIWYDNIRRAMLESGDLQRLIDEGVTGVTSNPTIFERAYRWQSGLRSSLEIYGG